MKPTDTVHFDGEDLAWEEFFKRMPPGCVALVCNESGGWDVRDNAGKLIGAMKGDEVLAFVQNQGGSA